MLTNHVPYYHSWASESAFRYLRLVSEHSGTGQGPIILSSTCVPNIVALARSNVADPHHIDADGIRIPLATFMRIRIRVLLAIFYVDPDPACLIDADADPDPSFHFA